MDDPGLLQAWRAGDEAAGAELIAKHTEFLARFFANKAAESMDDLLQATFLRCVESRDRIKDPDKFRSYLLTIAHRELLAYFRARSRERELFAPELTSVWDVEPRPSTIVVQQEEQRLLAEALRRIPLAYQVVLELYYWEDFSAPRIAEALEVPEGTVRSRLRRGRELLLETMQGLRASDVYGRPSLDDLERWARSIHDSD